ncbi:hypothetical protein [Actinomadura sp. WMMB 499]|uniref:hypothetical protein n=1 Tax=Actinomadura sp. WMMB 499 TaxID=1219491 RepID=UPI001247AC15|nr:hypothetical protein [Actinomadura sp. WMMB 499]QFG25815.1 hypothetical protein F7P10_36400 [Actinomadura sp. WMMB 499]
MSDQPGDILDEAGKVFDALLRRAARTGILGGPRPPGERDRPDRTEAPGSGDPGGDAWAAATAERPRDERGTRAGREAGEPRIATGAPECRDCPVCRAIAIRRAAGGDVARHLREAGESLLAAGLDVIAAADRVRDERVRDERVRDERARDERARDGRERAGGTRDGGTYQKRSGQESASRAAGTSERSGERRGRPAGDPWSAATGDSGGSGD